MPAPDLVWICVTAFAAVTVLLAALAAIMRLILVIFPEEEDVNDPMVIASVATVLQTIYPGARITKVEEIT